MNYPDEQFLRIMNEDERSETWWNTNTVDDSWVGPRNTIYEASYTRGIHGDWTEYDPAGDAPRRYVECADDEHLWI